MRDQGGTVMSDYLAYLTAQREVGDLVASALPSAPTRPHPPAPPGRLRRRAAQLLVRAARRVKPDAATTHRA
jgi:hypothetical protein